MSAKIRRIEESDLNFALDLANRERWSYDLADLKRLLRLFPNGCLIAEHGKAKAGWVVASTYGKLAWIGSLVVRKDLRKKGIGAALVDHAVKYAGKLGVRTVGLYSYSESVGFYERIGFKRDCEFEHIEGTGRKDSPKFSLRQPKDLGEVAMFDERYFRGNRKSLLEVLHEEFSNLLILQKETDVVGYVAGKDFEDSAEIGPWVCDASRFDVAEQLFLSELSQLSSRRVSLTIPSQNLEAHRITEKCGFQVKQRVVRMFVGSAEDLPRTDGIYGAAGLDVG